MNIGKHLSGKQSTIGQSIVYPLPIALDPAPYVGAMVYADDGLPRVSNGAAWVKLTDVDSVLAIVLESSEIVKFAEPPSLITVGLPGSGADFTGGDGLNKAFALLSETLPAVFPFGSLALKTEVRLLAGFRPTVPLDISDYDFSYVTISSVDDEILVDPDIALIGTGAFGNVFGAFLTARDVSISCAFKLDYAWAANQTIIDGVVMIGLRAMGTVPVVGSASKYAGFRNFSQNILVGGQASVGHDFARTDLGRQRGAVVLGELRCRQDIIRGDPGVASSTSVLLRNGGMISARGVGVEKSDWRVTAGVDSTRDLAVEGGTAFLQSDTLCGTNIPLNTLRGRGVAHRANTLRVSSYAQDNILGTVSQTAGLPTGALMERGANASGAFVRFADGTLICTHTVPLTGGGGVTINGSWVFPSGFLSPPSISFLSLVAPAAGARERALWHGVNATNCTLNASMNTNWPASSTETFSAMAIGRWF